MDYFLQTIKSKKAFAEIFGNGKKFFDSNSMAVFSYAGLINRVNDINTKPVIRFSVAVPKKSAKKAVVRNRIKRLMRESIRHFFSNYAVPDPCFAEFRIAFVWRNAPDHPGLISLKNVKPEIESLLNSAMNYWLKKNYSSSYTEIQKT